MAKINVWLVILILIFIKKGVIIMSVNIDLALKLISLIADIIAIYLFYKTF
nr:MAG TPA: hypothetical protein [Caudoviricetes sp.]